MNRDLVCVLIPVMNEKTTIGPVIEEFHAHGYYNILVADGNSTDGTKEIAEKLGAKVFVQKGKGKGAAMIEAFSKITDPYVLLLDGDGTNSPADADRMVEPLFAGRADHVIGNRCETYEKGAHTRLNFFGNNVMNRMFKWAHGVHMTDILSGYRAFTKASLEQMNLTEAGFEIETEISSEVVHHNLRFEIVPTYYKKRPTKPKLNPIRDGAKIILAINKYGKMNNPMFYFTVVGVVLALAGFLLGLYVVVEWLQGIEHLPMTVLTMLLIVTGILIFMLGLLSDMIVAYHREEIREMALLRKDLDELKKQ